MDFPPIWPLKGSNETTAYDGWFRSNSMDFRPGNMIYMIVALVGIIVSNACLAIRISSMREMNSLIKMSVTHMLVLVTYVLGSMFCVAACLLYFGHTIYNHSACHAAIILSLVFYLGQKLCLYLFLVERTHGVQANARPRNEDYVYLAGLAFVLVGFSAIGWALFMFHIDTFNITTGICHIGIARPVASALLGWDVFVNIFLTAVFVRRCKPYMVKGLRGTFLYPAIKGLLKKITVRHQRKSLAGGDVAIPISQDALIRVIRKAFWGCLGILASTATNFSLLLYWAGKEEVWFFFTLCTIDVTWALIILHWLTTAPHEMKSKPQTPNIYSAMPPGPSTIEHQPPHSQSLRVPVRVHYDTLQVRTNGVRSRT